MKSVTNNLKDAKQTVSYVMRNYSAHNFYMLRLVFKAITVKNVYGIENGKNVWISQNVKII